MKKSNHDKAEENRLKAVIYAWNYLEWGGAQVYFLGIARRIRGEAAVRAVMPEGTGEQMLKFCEKLGVPYEFIKGHTDYRPARGLRRKLERHRNKIRSEIEFLSFLAGYDFRDTVLHVELTPWQSVAALMWLCRRARVFVTMHNSLPPVPGWRRLLWKMKFRVISRNKNFHLFASNEDARRSLRELVPAAFYEKVKVTYTNVNPDAIDEALAAPPDRRARLRRFGVPEESFLVFCVGQFIDRKGRWTFLEAAKHLSETPDIAFVWISNSTLGAEEMEKIAGFGLDGRFFLIKSEDVGPEHIDLFKFLRAADAFALPSFQEGLPISLLEAMALGVPSISTNVNAIPEAVKHMETGLLVEAGDARGLAEAVLTLKNDADLRRRLSARGREHVLENFNEIRVAEIAYQSYREAFETD